MSRKGFKHGQRVEVRVNTSSGPWEPATYDKSEWRGWHMVKLDRERWINVGSGNETNADDPRACLSAGFMVPTRRLRASGAR